MPIGINECDTTPASIENQIPQTEQHNPSTGKQMAQAKYRENPYSPDTSQRIGNAISAFFSKVCCLPIEIKYCYQRATKGFCDRDVWNIDLWFLKKMSVLVKDLNRVKHGHPDNVTQEKWTAILNKMEESFKLSCYLDKDEELFKEIKIKYAKIMPKEIHERVFQNQFTATKHFRKKAIKLFAKHFDNLWD